MKEHVILIHGTFAYDTKDSGDAWWQRDGKLYNKLKDKYEVSLIDGRNLFKWSGDNKETHRRLFSEKLLEQIKKFEEKKIPYHLVGHSHGGSLIYNMFFNNSTNEDINKLLGVVKIEKLKYLKSWTTIGTPFIVQHSEDKPIYKTFKAYLVLIVTLFSIMLSLASFIDPTPIIHEISRDYFYEIIILVVILFVVFVYSVYWLIETFRFLRIENLFPKVEDFYANTWLGITSEKDEVISILTAVNQLAVKDLGVNSNSTSSEFDYIEREKSIYIKIKNKAFDIFVEPVIKPGFVRYIKSAIIGNDTIGVDKLKILTYPFKTNNSGFLLLDKDMENKLDEYANDHLKTNIKSVRNIMLDASRMNPMKAFYENNLFNGYELIHSSYFQHDEIISKIYDHIEKHSNTPSLDKVEA